jgi:hypothetical protein
MTVGISAAGLANKVLDGITRTGSFPTAGTLYVKLHTGDPSTGASNASANTTRGALTFSSAASGGVATATTLPSWASWASGSETISHISLWDASTSGNFLWSGSLTAAKSVSNGDTLSLSSLTLTIATVAS